MANHKSAIKRIRSSDLHKHRLEPADGEATISGAIIKSNKEGINSIQSIQIGGVLDRNLLS